MNECPKCGYKEATTTKTFLKIPFPEGFVTYCEEILMQKDVSDKNKDFIASLPEKVMKYKSISEAQFKWFNDVYVKSTGKAALKIEEIIDNRPAFGGNHEISENLDEVPF
jgi:hypothetical protein